MIPVFIGIGTFVLIIVAVVLSFLVLAQRAKSDGGMAAMGGGMMESAFGPDSGNVLVRTTIRATVAFFVLSFLLYLGYVHLRSHGSGAKGALPNISAPASTAPAASSLPAPSTAQPAASTVSVPVTAAPDAAKTSTTSSTSPKTP
jgi:preprotein translocase subunit SecG